MANDQQEEEKVPVKADEEMPEAQTTSQQKKKGGKKTKPLLGGIQRVDPMTQREKAKESALKEAGKEHGDRVVATQKAQKEAADKAALEALKLKIRE